MNKSYGRYAGGAGSFPALREQLTKFSNKIMPVLPQVTVLSDDTALYEEPKSGPGQMPKWLPWAALGTAAVVAGVAFTSARKR